MLAVIITIMIFISAVASNFKDWLNRTSERKKIERQKKIEHQKIYRASGKKNLISFLFFFFFLHKMRRLVTQWRHFRTSRKYKAMHSNARNLFFKKLFKLKQRVQPNLAN